MSVASLLLLALYPGHQAMGVASLLSLALYPGHQAMLSLKAIISACCLVGLNYLGLKGHLSRDLK